MHLFTSGLSVCQRGSVIIVIGQQPFDRTATLPACQKCKQIDPNLVPKTIRVHMEIHPVFCNMYELKAIEENLAS